MKCPICKKEKELWKCEEVGSLNKEELKVIRGYKNGICEDCIKEIISLYEQTNGKATMFKE